MTLKGFYVSLLVPWVLIFYKMLSQEQTLVMPIRKQLKIGIKQAFLDVSGTYTIIFFNTSLKKNTSMFSRTWT